MATHNERKTQFVSDLVGGSTSDIYLVTSISAVSYLTWCILKKKTTLFDDHRGKEGMVSSIVDFLLNWNNLLLSTTLYANNIPLLILLNILPLIPVFMNSTKSNHKRSKDLKKEIKIRKATINLRNLTAMDFLPFKTFVTVYRAQMMVITCISIMAVDFHIFPRRFAKVETWGTSMMDLGVGSFVFSMGLISARSYLRQNFNSKFNYKQTVLNSFKTSIPIFVLGLVRLVSVKSVDYHEHVTEYGIHWNFFFTLAFLPLLNALLSPIIMKLSPLVTSVLVSLAYEHFLINKNGLEYIVMSPRNNLFNSNREGILSLGGYFPIFLNGLALGSCILPVIPLPNSLFSLGISQQNLAKVYQSKTKITSPLRTMFIISASFQIAYYIIDTCYMFSVSRRMANLLYVIWVSAYNCTSICAYGWIERIVLGDVDMNIITDEDSEVQTDITELLDDSYVPTSLSDVNKNSLVLFLVANLATGCINLSISTIDLGTVESMIVLFFYELFLALFCKTLSANGIVLR